MFPRGDPTDVVNICREIMEIKDHKIRRKDPVSAINGDDRFHEASVALAEEDVRSGCPLSTSELQSDLFIRCPSSINTLLADKTHKTRNHLLRCRFKRSFQGKSIKFHLDWVSTAISSKRSRFESGRTCGLREAWKRCCGFLKWVYFGRRWNVQSFQRVVWRSENNC